ncbi:MAG: peptidase S8/S53 subtilisin kexin sedolisin [Chlorobi bacterium OLB5]|nr:MAG: peptidase S8/S53 subtilisin kexin sedolisin [Chlorobi bacterium OLB5]
MKKILPYLAAFVMIAAVGFYFLYTTTIMVVQTVPNDSLAIGHDRSLKAGDTVTFTARVVAPPLVKAGIDNRVLLRGTTSRTAYLQDTSNALFGGIIVRQGSVTANTQFTTLDTGAKVIVTGIVGEFPDIISSGATQIALDTTLIVTELPTIKKRPVPINVNISDFDSLGTIKFLSGEKYEGMYVQINNVTVGPQSPLGARNIRSLLDAQGNKIYLRDFSNFFSVSPNDTGFPVWTPPSIGATVTSIRGVIINSAYADANGGLYGYVIVPIYPNDLTMGNTPPFISSVSRNPGIPKPANTVQVNAVITDTLDKPLSVDSCQLFYRINRGSYTRLHMNPSGNIYSATMPAQPLGTLVEYFIKAKDNLGATRLNPSDTSRSTYFYYVRNSDTMTIRDVQYTPNNGGFSAYNGYTVTTEGIVTADTSDIPAFSFTGEGGTQTSPRRVIIQDPNIAGGWAGIWIDGNPTDPMVKGNRVRVTGQVSETNGMTRIIVATPGDIQVLQTGQPLPAFTVLTPAVVADNKIDGDTTAEKYESMLIRFATQSVISCVNAASSSGCTSEFPVPDTSFRRNFGEILVVYPGENIEARIELQDGNHDKVNGWDRNKANYYNPSLPGSLMWKWDGISSLQGVLYYAFGKYKMVPRTNADFGTVIAVEPINEIATQFYLKQNYPNPFNPVTNIIYNLPVEAEVSLKIYNLLGQEVKTIVSGIQNRGRHEVMFNGSDLASGMYIYVIEANTFEGSKFREVKKMVLVK